MKASEKAEEILREIKENGGDFDFEENEIKKIVQSLDLDNQIEGKISYSDLAGLINDTTVAILEQFAEDIEELSEMFDKEFHEDS